MKNPNEVKYFENLNNLGDHKKLVQIPIKFSITTKKNQTKSLKMNIQVYYLIFKNTFYRLEPTTTSTFQISFLNLTLC